MANVKVVTSSAADLPPHLTDKLGIHVVPLNVHFGLESYRDGIDLSKPEFYARLADGGVLPTTSAPSVAVFESVYRELASEADEIVSIHLGSSFSVVYDNAYLAAEEVTEAKVVVIDSGQASMGMGWLAVLATRAARDGADLASVVDTVRAAMPRIRLYAVLDTLEYLQKGGRIGAAAATLGTLLNIKPLIEIRDGAVLPVEKVRTRRKAIRRLVELVAALGPLEEMCVLHTNTSDGAEQLAEALSTLFPRQQIVLTEAGAIIGTHAGPGAVGVACVLAL